MKQIKRFASEHPLGFSLVATIGLILLLVVSAVLGNLWSGKETYGQPGSILGRLISITILLMALSYLGWLRSAGFTTLGGRITWVEMVLLLAYAIAASAYVITGKFDINLANPSLTNLVILFILAAAFLEEAAFRGLILHASVRAWGNTRRGLLKSILVSSLLFCSIHLLDFLSGRPPLNVLLQSLQAFFFGVFLAVLVLRSKSIYPAAFFHAVLNLAGYLSFGSKGIEPAPSTWLQLSLVMLPLAVLGMYQLRGRPDGHSVPG